MLTHSFDSKKDVLAFLDRYVASLPALATEFEQRAAAAGLRLDGSPPSLLTSNRHFLNELESERLPPTDEVPLWWDPKVLTREHSPDFWFTRPQLHWVDVYQARVALLLASQPGAYWSVFKGPRNEYRNGTPILVVDWHPGFDIRNYVYGEALRKIKGKVAVPDSELYDYLFGMRPRNTA